MRHLTAKLALLITIGTLSACATSPLGRSQLLMHDEASLARTALTQYNDMKNEVPVSKNKALTAYVNCVVQPLTREVIGDNWEVTLFDSDQINAFALPGGKIGVYTGILKIANTPDRLAAVVGHEIAHVLSHHANERMSQATLANVGIAVLGIASNRDTSTQLGIAALGLGVQFGILMPFSREHELEADILGLDIMAKAGFNPQAAPDLWRAMKANHQDKKQDIPEWMSTHPSDDTRIQALMARQSRALALMEDAHSAGKRPRCKAPD